MCWILYISSLTNSLRHYYPNFMTKETYQASVDGKGTAKMVSFPKTCRHRDICLPTMSNAKYINTMIILS